MVTKAVWVERWPGVHRRWPVGGRVAWVEGGVVGGGGSCGTKHGDIRGGLDFLHCPACMSPGYGPPAAPPTHRHL